MGHRLFPRHPALYHGKDSSRPYFEGWYFKQASNKGAFSVIPGIFRGMDEKDDIAFIQVIFGTPPESHFVEYPIRLFHYDKKDFHINIADNDFSLEKIDLNIKKIDLRANMVFSNIVPIETSLFSPAIMGVFSYLPAMQCNHGVLSLTHNVNGAIRFGNKDISFDNAYGYIEKDWGESFPKSWIWMQCNDNKTALMCALAIIPYLAFHFTGLICVLLAKGKQYRFATYNGSKILSVEATEFGISVQIKKQKYRLEICARTNSFAVLKAPEKAGMTKNISESISAEYHITLYENEKKIFEQKLNNGGLEVFEHWRMIKNNHSISKET